MPHIQLALVALLSLMFAAAPASGQEAVANEAALVDRPIAAIRFEGLERVSEQKVRNNIRSAVGEPYDPRVVRLDVELLNRLGDFKYIEASARLNEDGTVDLTFEFTEAPIINVVQVVGNKLVADEDLLALVGVIEGGPRDDFLIQNARRQISEKYRQQGHYLTTVEIDESQLDESGVLIFRVIEGPRVRVKAVEFEGNDAFSDKKLQSQVKTRTAIWLLRRGELDELTLSEDVAALDRFYKDRGYLDVRVDRTIELSPDNREAKVTYLISEGEQFTLRSVKVSQPDGSDLAVFSREQIAAILVLKTGDVYDRNALQDSVKAVQDAYGVMGYLDVRVQPFELRSGDRPEVDLVLDVVEGRRFQVGLVQINGNFLTKDKVIRRQVRLQPGRPFDATEIDKSKRRIERTRLFNDARITVQEEDPDNPGYRDVLVEVKERNTGSVNFGIAIGSDSGVFGELSLNQTNFDIADVPESFEEFIKGRAFRGAGQQFNMTLQPGDEIFQYSISLTEPYFLETNNSLTTSASIFQRSYNLYDENRLRGNIAIGRRLGDIWTISARARVEQVELDEISIFAPTEIFLDQGPDLLTGLAVSLVRSTAEDVIRPRRGSRLSLNYERVGALGGDLEFNKFTTEYTVYFTIFEDFLGRASTLRLNGELGYVFGGDRAPTYEQFYRGGRTFRGFDFREISPKGDTIFGFPSTESVGGTWQIFFGAQYEFPIFEETFNGVLFVDSGTVTDDPGFEDYRVSVGFGIRLYVPQLGPAPLAFDFGFPLIKLDTDEEQLFSFSAELPF